MPSRNHRSDLMKTETSDLWTAGEIAAAWRVKADTIRSWARRGLIPAIRPSPKVVRFDPAEVRTAIVERAATGSRRAKVGGL